MQKQLSKESEAGSQRIRPVISIPLVALLLFLAVSPALSQEITDIDVSVKPLGLSNWISLDLINLAGASVNDLPTFLARSEFRITIQAEDGNWIGVSMRDSRGDIYDIPAQQVRSRGNDFYWTLPSGFADGAIQLTTALWDDYDQSSDRMVGELDRVSWSYVARKGGGSAY